MHKPPVFNAARALDRTAWAHPERTSLVYGERAWTVREAALDSRRLAQLLAQAGVSRGDRVMVVARNSPYHLLAYVACARLGAVFVPVSHRLTQPEVQSLVDFTAPRVLICEPEIAARGAFASTGTIIHFAIDDDPAAGPLAPGLANGYLALGAGIAALDGELFADDPGDGDPALGQHGYPEGTAAIFFTSGSASGKPRAVELTHENLWWGSRNFREGFQYRGDETVLVSAPLTHIGGFNGTTLDIFASGGRVVILRAFDAGEVLRSIAEHGVDIMFGVPTMYLALLEHPGFADADLGSWRLPLIGGASVPPAILDRLERAGLRPVNVWGMTETAGSGAFLPPGTGRPGAVGRPFAYVEARIVDPETLRDAPSGELLVRGPSVSPGYWHNEGYNQTAFVRGWLRTGDLAALRDGAISILGRTADRITTGGEGVDPAEVEDVLREYPGVREAVVFGLPDETWGEVVAAALVVDSAFPEPVLAQIREFAGRVLAGYKLPRRLALVEAVPLNVNGKVDRRAVRAALSGAAPAGPSTAGE